VFGPPSDWAACFGKYFVARALLIMADNTSTFMELMASIVSAYVRHNSVPSAELLTLIGQVHTALTRVSSGHGEALGNALRPAIPVKKSIASDYIICLEDGKKFKSLKRHLRTHYDLTPEQYREKWGLGSDYPMVAPNYAAQRSRLANKWDSANSGRDTSRPWPPAWRRSAGTAGNCQWHVPSRHPSIASYGST